METEFPSELQRRFEQAIVEGEYARGQLLTSSDLAHRFEVTTGEMLQVLLAEHRKGLVVEQENGVYEVLSLATQGIASVFVHTAKSGLKPSSSVRVVRIEPATPAVADKLDLLVGAPVSRLERTRYANGEALANQINYIPFEICPGLEQHDVSHYSFQKLLEEKYFAFTVEAEEDCEVVAANEQDVEILDLPRGSSVLEIRRLALSATGCPVVWASIRVHPDRYRYVAELWPLAADLLTNRHQDD